MGFLGGIGSIVNPLNIAALGMGPVGIGMMFARPLVSAVGQQFIQQLGDKLGLPQGVVDMARSSFALQAGDIGGAGRSLGDVVQGFGSQFGASPFEAGEVERNLTDLIDQATTDLAQSREAREARSGGGRSWLMALAENLGRVADKLANEMDQMSQTLGDGANKSSQNLKFAAKSQEFSQFFSSANTVIKTLGEARSQGARTQ